MPKRLSRVQFVKLGASVFGAAAGAYLLYEGAPWLNSRKEAARVRRPLEPASKGTSRMHEWVRYATLAASGHNAQPWKFRIEENTIQIHPDSARHLPAVDPIDRELWISLGCALENLTLAARSAGFESEIIYPGSNDWIQIDFNQAKPEEGAHFASIRHRQNTRSPYDHQKVGAAELAKVMSIPVEHGIELHLFDSPSSTENVLEYVTAGNLSQFRDRAFIQELVEWIRFDKREALASMDGLFSLCMGTPAVPRWLGQQVVRHMDPQSQADADANLLRSSAGAIAISSTKEDKTAWVRTGQVYQRLALRLTSLNIKSAFLNQPNEVAEVRKQFQTALGFGDALPQLLLRFGYANPMPSSLRRSVDDVIVAV